MLPFHLEFNIYISRNKTKQKNLAKNQNQNDIFLYNIYTLDMCETMIGNKNIFN